MGHYIYMDHAATTAVLPEVLDSMIPYFAEAYGNPSTFYQLGSAGKTVLEEAREQIAGTIGAKTDEIYFTSGGTESDNWALKAVAETYENKGKHIITTGIEHHATLNTCGYLESRGFQVTYLNVDEDGMISLDDLQKELRPDTILISIMTANNEIGTIEPIAAIGAIAREHGILFHTDAVQAFGHVELDVNKMHIDLLSASAHKFNGPKGVGFLYVRRGVKLRSFLHGGAQERKRRAGTENIPGIVGMAKAARLALENREEKSRRLCELRDYLIERVLEEIPDTRLNGHRKKRLPGNANFTFSSVEGESLLIMLDMEGICASGGSACTTGSRDPSHVLTAIGLTPELARGSLRLTLGEENTREEVDFVVGKLKQMIERLRNMSS